MHFDLSIYIPTFNRVGPLIELLNELRPQVAACAEAKIEVVVSDNCSTDQTCLVMQEALRIGHVDVYLKHARNRGADQNILECMHYARGDYVWLLCDDDLPARTAVQRIWEAIPLCRKGDVRLIYLNRSVESMSGEVLIDRVISCVEGFETDLARLMSSVGRELLTASSLVLKRGGSPGRYTQRFGIGGLISPLALALDAIDNAGAYLFSDPQVRYREGDKSSWISQWPEIRDQRVPRLLRTFCAEHEIPCSF